MDYRKTCDMESRRIVSDVNSVICDFTEKKKNRFDKDCIWNYTRSRHFRLPGVTRLDDDVSECGAGRWNLHSDRKRQYLDDGWRKQYQRASGAVLSGTISEVSGYL